MGQGAEETDSDPSNSPYTAGCAGDRERVGSVAMAGDESVERGVQLSRMDPRFEVTWSLVHKV